MGQKSYAAEALPVWTEYRYDEIFNPSDDSYNYRSYSICYPPEDGSTFTFDPEYLLYGDQRRYTAGAHRTSYYRMYNGWSQTAYNYVYHPSKPDQHYVTIEFKVKCKYMQYYYIYPLTGREDAERNSATGNLTFKGKQKLQYCSSYVFLYPSAKFYYTFNTVRWHVYENPVDGGDGYIYKTCYCGAKSASASDKTGISYKIVYNGNGATSGSTATSSHTYGTAKALTSNGFTKTGYTFAGWATSATGNVVYGNGASVNNLTKTNNGIVTLYAKWTANIYFNNKS